MRKYHHDVDALVIIPTYNEAANIALLIETIFADFPLTHLLIVDDASPDGTSQIVTFLQANYPHQLHLLTRPQKLGLGTAYVAGFQFALERGYQYIFTMDADFSHPTGKLRTLYESCKKEGYDVAIGSRYIQGVNVVNWPMKRMLLSYGANWMVRLITGVPIKDCTAGFQCYTKSVLAHIHLPTITSIGYGFQVEIKFLAWKYGFRIKEIPIIFTNRVRGVSKMSHHIILEAFVKIIRLKVGSLFKQYHRKRSIDLSDGK
eukprot:gene712-883_t